MTIQPGPRVLFFDIETAPALVWVWNQWQTNVIATEQDWYLLCVAYKWQGDAETSFVSAAQAPGFKADSADDYYVARALAKLLDEADIVVADNGDKFDVRKTNARFIYHGINPPSPYRTIDTKKESTKNFANYSNSLAELGRLYGLGAKAPHEGFGLWRACMAGDPDAWVKMEGYARQDVVLLEKLYDKLLPWMGYPGKSFAMNRGLWAPGEHVCPKCGSDNLKRNGTYRTRASVFQTWECKGCGGFSRSTKREKVSTVLQ